MNIIKLMQATNPTLTVAQQEELRQQAEEDSSQYYDGRVPPEFWDIEDTQPECIEDEEEETTEEDPAKEVQQYEYDCIRERLQREKY